MATATKPTPTTPANIARINAAYNALQPLMVNLASRWADESQYEDIAEYGKLIAKELPEGFTLVKMTKRPFGFTFSIGTGAVYVVKMTRQSYEWKRLS